MTWMKLKMSHILMGSIKSIQIDTKQEWNLAFVFCYKRGYCFTETVYHFHYVVKRYQLLYISSIIFSWLDLTLFREKRKYQLRRGRRQVSVKNAMDYMGNKINANWRIALPLAIISNTCTLYKKETINFHMLSRRDFIHDSFCIRIQKWFVLPCTWMNISSI